MRLHRLLACSSSVLALALCAASAPLAHADTIDWTTWTSSTSGSPGSASGTIGSRTVSYSGQTSGLYTDYPSWNPTSSYIGGVVGNAPPAADNSVQLDGGVSYTETVTFSSVVADPIIAIWSLGQSNVQASFVFPSTEPISLVAGGPSSEYGGGSLTLSGNSVLGSEGNGVVVVNGDYSSITFLPPPAPHVRHYSDMGFSLPPNHCQAPKSPQKSPKLRQTKPLTRIKSRPSRLPRLLE
jgi:hypothetical protein